MNRSLRKAHLRRFGLVAVLLSIGISAALMNRPESRSLNSTAQVSGDEDLQSGEVVTRSPFTAVEGLILEVGSVQFSRGGPQAFARLIPSSPLSMPDVLVYWTDEDLVPKPGDDLPKNVTFLGDFPGVRPAVFMVQSVEPSGVLVLFSLAHGEVIDALRMNGGGIE